MKIFANTLCTVLIYLLGISVAFAKPNPPAPTFRRPPPPPGLPIDDNLYLLFGFAILLGSFLIYNHYLKTKTPS